MLALAQACRTHVVVWLLTCPFAKVAYIHELLACICEFTGMPLTVVVLDPKTNDRVRTDLADWKRWKTTALDAIKEVNASRVAGDNDGSPSDLRNGAAEQPPSDFGSGLVGEKIFFKWSPHIYAENGGWAEGQVRAHNTDSTKRMDTGE